MTLMAPRSSSRLILDDICENVERRHVVVGCAAARGIRPLWVGWLGFIWPLRLPFLPLPGKGPIVLSKIVPIDCVGMLRHFSNGELVIFLPARIMQITLQKSRARSQDKPTPQVG